MAEPTPAGARYATTCWSRVRAAAGRSAADAGDALAELCGACWYPVYALIRRRGHDPEAAAALAADPTLADDRADPPRFDAARAAAAAGTGKDRDDPSSDEPARAPLRRQALDWLGAELASREKAADSGDRSARQATCAALTDWRTDPDLAGVREPAALQKLPEAEQAEWRALWAAVDALQRRTAMPPRGARP
jgi:hypothetical protein